MDQEQSEAYSDIHSIFCPNCGKPMDEVQERLGRLEGETDVLECPKCDAALTSGKFLGF